jgi:cytochrome bd ubiquinol oxidase subunit II
MLAYVVLDGYDLGVGILLRSRRREQKDTDGRLDRPVLGRERDLAGARRRACCWSPFRFAHGVILTALYLPVALMLIGLILRGVAFEFRVKAQAQHKPSCGTRRSSAARCCRGRPGLMLGRTSPASRGWAADRLRAADRRSAWPPATRCSAPAGC